MAAASASGHTNTQVNGSPKLQDVGTPSSAIVPQHYATSDDSKIADNGSVAEDIQGFSPASREMLHKQSA